MDNVYFLSDISFEFGVSLQDFVIETILGGKNSV